MENSICFDPSAFDVYMQSLVETTMQAANFSVALGFVTGLVCGAMALWLILLTYGAVRARRECRVAE